MMANTLGPSRSMGVNAKYQKKWLFASYGLFFHAVEDAETRTYVEDNNKDYGRKEGLAHTAKVVFQHFIKTLMLVCTSVQLFLEENLLQT